MLGAALVAIVHHFFHVNVSDLDASLIGSVALSAGVGLGHALAKGGVLGLVKEILHGGSASA